MFSGLPGLDLPEGGGNTLEKLFRIMTKRAMREARRRRSSKRRQVEEDPVF